MIVSLSANTISCRSSRRPCREPFGRRWRRTPTTTRWAVFFKKNMSHRARLIFPGSVGWNSFLVVVFNWSLRPSRASLDQSMLCKDERSKFKPAREVKHRNQSEISPKSLALPHLIFIPLPCCPHYVAVQYLCIYFCCYLIIIIYCIRTRFALFEDEFQ